MFILKQLHSNMKLLQLKALYTLQQMIYGH